MAKEVILGIDLGTTNSVVSYMQDDRTVKVIPLRKALTPVRLSSHLKQMVMRLSATLQSVCSSLTLILFTPLRERWVLEV